MDNPGLLSQSEIDALLASVSAASAESEAKELTTPAENQGGEVKRYDFRRPDRFSKEQMRALRMIHETWARRVSVSLTAHLRTSVEVTLADIDQGMYTSLTQQLPEKGIYYILGLLPLTGHFMLHMNIEMAMMLADRLMGGPGTVYNVERRMTDLEVELLRGVTDKALTDLREAWATVAEMRPRIDDVSLNMMLVPIALPADAIVWVSFEVRIRGNASDMLLGLPYPVLKPIAGQLSPYNWATNPTTNQSGRGSGMRQDIEAHLRGLRLPVSAVLGSAPISFEELIGLQPGDVLPLDVQTDDLCPVLVSGSRKFLAKVGLRKRKVAIQVERSVENAGQGKPGRPTVERKEKPMNSEVLDRSGLATGSQYPEEHLVQPAHFAALSSARSDNQANHPIEFLYDVTLQVSVELGRTQMTIKELLEMGQGTVVELNKLAGEPVEILVNGKAIARGEVVVIDDMFGVRVIDVISPFDRINSLR